MQRSQENIPSQWGPAAAGPTSGDRITQTSRGTGLYEEEGLLRKATNAISDRIEEIDFGESTDRLAQMIRRYPVQTLLIGVFIGFVLGRGRI
jgi:hypothetical protein